jgi:diaminohydroxyphosphoribosylaminopyrimidine deaminase / 5-amino-6-(5-phosphoribosylamino)uracil reductase
VTEREAMRRALALARKGWGRVHPNPLVGAVLLADGEPVGEAYHAEYGREHAERLAIASAGGRAPGATLVVTLEPCAHTGKQPPCTDAIIAAKVRRVVAAVADPNPLAGGGAERLRAAGLDVELGLLGTEATRQNAAFFHRIRNPSRPWVALKLATSLDYRIADRAGQSKWISGAEARAYVHALRVGFDAIAVGGRTAIHDNPLLTPRGHIEPRVAPTRVIFAGKELLPPSLAVFAFEGETVVVTSRALAPEARQHLRHAAILPADTLAEALVALRASGIGSLLVEGGGRLAGGLLSAGLVDRYHWIQSPLWLGESGVPATAGWEVAALADAERWSVVERRALGEDTLLVMDRDPCLPAS